MTSTPETDAISAPPRSVRRAWLRWLPVALAGLALLVSVLLWQKLARIQEQLARQSADTGLQAGEARAMAKARTARFDSADALIDDLEKARQQ